MTVGKIKIWLFIIGILVGSPIWGQKNLPKDFCLNADEIQLFSKINELRVTYGKEELQLSASLSFVAKTHVNDLLTNLPDTSVCGLSSWSDKGNWKACCYNAYIPTPECMRDKPKELTPYPYHGYELVTYFDDLINIDTVVSLFSDTKEVLNLILSQEDQGKKKWACCGIGINDHYVSVWFGQRKDALPSPEPCDGREMLEKSTPINQAISPGSYFLIFGSFNSLQEGKEALKKLKKDDFTDAGILNKNGKVRIYLSKFNSLKEAMFAKQQLPKAYSEAWILKE